MKLLLILLAVAAFAYAEDNVAEPCDREACQLPNCRCSDTSIPGGLDARDVPQFVMVSFDDALTANLVDNFFLIPFLQRQNPDGCPASMSLLVSHEYTDYSRVNQMYSFGHEIGLHSISHRSDLGYWAQASPEVLADEFADQRILTSHFANIPQNVMKGIRSPFFQMAGDNTFQMMKDNNFLYDYGWPTQNFVNPGLWPYTLDYASIQDCSVPPCPTGSFPGIWVVPVLNWFDELNVPCAMADGCLNVDESVDGIFNFMMENFERQYLGNRAPFPVSLHGSWFLINPNTFIAYLRFLDHLSQLPDVYLVAPAKVIEWVQNPIPLGELQSSSWTSCNLPPIAPPCFSSLCPAFSSFHGFTFFMTQCTPQCPSVYPWIGNPLGQ